ncbi:MAG: polysulfide reductase NrfD [Deltaproteobacteria bacterium]|nr:polysulfide reductase NrfD [Deltaproteobacteria bacterium]
MTKAYGRKRTSPLPDPTRSWYLVLAASFVALGAALFAYSFQLRHGDIVSGLRDPGRGGAAWALYIAAYVYFVGVSFAGITVASMARIFHIDTLKPLTRIAELLTIVALIAGALMVLADLGRPLDGLIKLPMLARPSSPFFGTFTLVVSGYLFSSVIYFFVSGRRDAARMFIIGPWFLKPFYWLWASGYRGTAEEHARHSRTSFWLALTIVPLLVVAHSTLGFIFGIQSGRPGWYSALMAPGFVVMAGVSGTGALIVISLILRRMLNLDFKDSAIHWLGNFLWILSLVYIYFLIVEELTATYAGPEMDRHVAHEIVTGDYAWSYWIMAACLFLTFLIPFLLYILGKKSTTWVAVASVLANVAAVLKRLLIVIPSQTHGSYLPAVEGSYDPTWIEWTVVSGAGGLVLISILIFGRIFPLVPGHQPPLIRTLPLPRDRARTLVTAVWAAGAVGLLLFGLSDAFRLWSGAEIDPMVPFSPVIFANGVIFIFTTAVVYEVLPTHLLEKPWHRRLVQKAHFHIPRAPRTALGNRAIRAFERRAPVMEQPRSEGDTHE